MYINVICIVANIKCVTFTFSYWTIMFLFAFLFVADKFHFPFSMFYQMHIKLLMPIVDACSIKTIWIIWSVSDSRVIPRMSCQEQNMIEYIIFYWPYHSNVVLVFAFHEKILAWKWDKNLYISFQHRRNTV